MTWLEERKDRLEAVFVTHAHEDHVGALGMLWDQLQVPVYARRFTAMHARLKMEERGQDYNRVETVRAFPEAVEAGPFRVSFLPVAHSIPQAVVLLLEFPAGRVLHTGDFKLAGEPSWRLDLDALAAQADPPIFLMLADSTGARTGEATAEEAHLAGRIDDLLGEAPGRVFVTVFSSHVDRIRNFLQGGRRHGRSGAALGRSMERYTTTARGLGLLPEGNFTSLDEVADLPPPRQMFFISGSQGETSSAMDRLSAGQIPRFSLGPDDTVIFSVSTIPGRELPVSQMVDRFLETGCRVRMHTDELPTHVSGHGSAAELRRLCEVLRPDAVIPVHGSLRYLLAGRDLALSCGVPEAFLCLDGHRAVFEDGAWRVEPAPISEVLHLENPQDSPICEESLRQRRRMAASGVVLFSCALDRKGRPRSPLQLTLRGIGRVEDHPALAEDCARAVLSGFSTLHDPDPARVIELLVRRFFKSETGKKPQVVVHLID
ncbi:MAG: hypothetical protein CVT83_08310 [Alphaproteobacteria bacterium HGW-Alphaproteobacteria-5]|nr:MAG: hypothetical protein CVT83_08310 [Alphaproteobacteria bacterium HGW-Alphaproteobacteria-5]